MALNTSAALSVFQQMFADGKVRAHPVHGPAMEPTFYHGEFVGILPVDKFEFDAIYLLGDDNGSSIYRCQLRFDMGRKIRCWHDNPIFAACEMTLTREQFSDMCLGRVVAVCGYPDRPRGFQGRAG